jgi:hypothetical protein
VPRAPYERDFTLIGTTDQEIEATRGRIGLSGRSW